MNKAMIRYILGWILTIEGFFMLLPWLVGLIYRESCAWIFLLVGLCSMGAGFLIVRKKPKRTVFYMREGCVATALSWILISFVGCLPFWISGEIPSFTDAFLRQSLVLPRQGQRFWVMWRHYPTVCCSGEV